MKNSDFRCVCSVIYPMIIDRAIDKLRHMKHRLRYTNVLYKLSKSGIVVPTIMFFAMSAILVILQAFFMIIVFTILINWMSIVVCTEYMKIMECKHIHAIVATYLIVCTILDVISLVFVLPQSLFLYSLSIIVVNCIPVLCWTLVIFLITVVYVNKKALRFYQDSKQLIKRKNCIDVSLIEEKLEILAKQRIKLKQALLIRSKI